MLAGEGDVEAVIDAHGWRVTGEDELVAAVDAAIADSPDIAAKIREGNQGAVGPLVGAVMKATGGSADAKRARELILERLALACTTIRRSALVTGPADRARRPVRGTGSRRRRTARSGCAWSIRPSASW